MHTLAKTAYFQPSNAQFLKNFTVFGKNICKCQKKVLPLLQNTSHGLMRKIAFIVNPISGNKKMQEQKRCLPDLVATVLDRSQWSAEVVHTEYAGHATELARNYAQAGYDAVVAVGGDGTVNEVAQGLRDSRTTMGIVPMGSGNGLARHLHIPMNVRDAINLLNHSRSLRIDYGWADDHLFVSTCGTGFDAEVAAGFAGSAKRGLMTYLRTILRLVFTYKAQRYRLIYADRDETHRAFLITFANSNQWGNNALIAPQADLQDGKMDVMIMSPYALWGSLPLAAKLFAGTIDRSRLMHTLRTDELTLRREHADAFHIDGDPTTMGQDIHIRIVKGGLNVLVAE